MSPSDSWSIYIYVLQKLVQEMCSTMSDTVLVFWILNKNEIQIEKKISWTVFFNHITLIFMAKFLNFILIEMCFMKYICTVSLIILSL